MAAEVKVIIRTILEGSKNAKIAGRDLKELNKTAKQLTVGLAAMGATFVAAFKFAKEGAAINQVTESFDRMNDAVFKTPALLNEMRDASKGTVRDFDLMRGVLTLVAGQSDEVSRKFAEAAPRLLEIAKASNKLNPSLGDTAFLFESLSLGIKRGSKLILDNLGLNISLGIAHETFAKSIGKSTKELTEQEKVLAVMNAALEQGDQLINQVGGSTDTQADSFARLEIEIQGATDAIKQWLGSGLLPVIAVHRENQQVVEDMITSNIALHGSFDDLITQGQKVEDALSMAGGLATLITGTRAEVREGIFEVAEAMAVAADGFEEYEEGYREAFGIRAREEMRMHRQALGLSKEEFFNLARAVALTRKQFADYADEVGSMRPDQAEMSAFIAETADSADALDEWTDEAKKAAIEAGKLADEMDSMPEKYHNVTNRTMQYVAGLELAASIEEIHAERLEETADAAKEAADALAELTAKQGDYFIEATKADAETDLLVTSLDRLGQQYFTVGGRTAEQSETLEELQSQYDKAAGTIADYQSGVKGITLTDEKRNENIAKQQELMGLLAEKMGPLADITGELASVENEFKVSQEEVNKALYEAVDAAGAGPEVLAALGVALGELTEDEAEAALKIAALRAEIDRLGEAIAEGLNIEDARAQLQDFIGELEGAEQTAATAELAPMAEIDTTEFDRQLDNIEDDAIAFGAMTYEAAADLNQSVFDEKLDLVKDASQEFADTVYETEFDAKTDEAMDAIKSIEAAAEDAAGTYEIKFNVSSVGGGPPPGFQHGGSMTVPPGFPNDNFIIGVSSGERVDVRTPSQQQRPRGGGNTYNYTIVNRTREAAALTLALIQERRRERLDEFMGV